MQLGIDDLPLRYSCVPVIVLDDSQILYFNKCLECLQQLWCHAQYRHVND